VVEKEKEKLSAFKDTERTLIEQLDNLKGAA
jgi:hypothetical protein